MEYKYTEHCREISGFGGSYENACRTMVIEGMKYLEQNKGADPSFDQFKKVFGITTNENEDMKLLQKAMLNSIGGDCTGAMMQACTNHVLFAYKNGWDNYIKKMETPEL